MTEKEELAFQQGQTSVALYLLGAMTPYLGAQRSKLTAIKEHCETRAALLEIKGEYGLDFPDDLYIPDILNKHIIPLIEAAEDERKRQRGAE